MNIPRKHINETVNFIKSLESLQYVHYRDLYKTIDHTNFQIATKIDYKRVPIDAGKNVHWQFNLIKDSNTIIYEYTSKMGSKYIITDTGDVYRLANHWGAVASCQWTLEGEGCLIPSVFITGEWELGTANLKDFVIFRCNHERRRDKVLNPDWINQIVKVEPLKKKLHTMLSKPEFKELPVEDKKLIGKSYGKLRDALKSIEK